MKKASKKKAVKKPVVRKVQALITVEVHEGPLGKRAVADAVKTAFSAHTYLKPDGHVLHDENIKRVAVNVNI